jgi:DNA-binding response OmpR family regulator
LLQDEIIHLGSDYEFTSFPPTLARQGQNIILTRKELKLLEVLVIYRNRTTTSTVIEQHVWPNVVVGESSLRSLIRRLRKKLPELTIQTITGIGYMLSTPQ